MIEGIIRWSVDNRVIVLFLAIGLAFAGLQALRATPMEAVYLHLSNTTLFPGEYLYYSLYCINTRTWA